MRLTVGRISHIREVSAIEKSIKEKSTYIRIKTDAPKLKRAIPPVQQALLRREAVKRINAAAQLYGDTDSYNAVEQAEQGAIAAAHEAGSAVFNDTPKMRLTVGHVSSAQAEAETPTPQEQMKRLAIKEKVKEANIVREKPTDSISIKERPTEASFAIKTREHETAKAPGRSSIKGHSPSAQYNNIRADKPALKRAQKRSQVKIIRETQQNTQRTKTITEKAAAAVSRALSSAGKAVSELLAAGGGALAAVLIPLVLIVGCAVFLFGGGGSTASPVSEEVNAYTPLIQMYAAEHGIPEYVELIKAVMMQESAGRGNDPMQASESTYNTRFPHAPGSITDPEYSINVGVQALADVLATAGVESPIDIERISLALQGYIFGPGYISWALSNYGEYSQSNTVEFSQMMAAQMGWTSYGDAQYVDHVLRYYSLGSVFGGNNAMAQVALSQVGNVGGMPYWSWYGYSYRVEWCGCFVSWCAAQCGILDSSIPKFAYCPTAVRWFQDNGAWQSRDYTPAPGDVIFFDWLKDGRRDGVADHVGIAERVENGLIYTIEGNVNDSCVQGQYYIGAPEILGYGVLNT